MLPPPPLFFKRAQLQPRINLKLTAKVEVLAGVWWQRLMLKRQPLLIRFYPSGEEQQEARTHKRSLMQIAGFDFPCH